MKNNELPAALLATLGLPLGAALGLLGGPAGFATLAGGTACAALGSHGGRCRKICPSNQAMDR